MARPAPSALLVSFACLWAVRLEAATVMIVDPASPSGELTETVTRLHGELLSVGLAATIVDRDGTAALDSGSERAWLQGLATDRGIDAAIEVIGDGHLEAVDVWVFHAAPAKADVVRLPAEPGVEDAPARLAIRAVDLLRSRLIERDLDRVPPPESAGSREPARARVGLALGGAVLTSLGGVGPALLPMVRIEAAPGRLLALQAELAGLGTRPEIGGSGDGARVAQQYGLLGVCACAPTPSRVRWVVALSAGAMRTTAEGQADAPLEAHSVAHWSFLLEASAGARVRLGGRAHLTLAAHLQVAQPYVEVRVANAGSATTGRPNALLTVAVGEWL